MFTLELVDESVNHTFRPNDNITKEEAVIILNKLYGYDEGDLSHMIEIYNENPYEDIDENY